MTKARHKAKAILARQHRTFRELAAAADLTEATVHNVLDERASSKKSRQAITNALGTKIWPDIEAQTTQGIIPQDTVFLRLSERGAAELHAKFPDSTQVHGIFGSHGPFVVEFLKDTPAIISLKHPNSPPIPVPRSKGSNS